MSSKYFSKSDPTAAVSNIDSKVQYVSVQSPLSTIKDYTKCFIDWIEKNNNEYASDPENLNVISEDIPVPPCYKVLTDTYTDDADKGIVRGNKRRVVYPLRERGVQQIKEGLINKTIAHVDIPYGTKKIARYKFSGQSLQSVYIPAGVTRIEDCAFNGCNGLKSVKLPNSTVRLGNGVFSGCKNLETVEIPEGVTSIGESAFSYCGKLEGVDIPNSITSISNYTFINCGGLTAVKLPDSVTRIGGAAFNMCSRLPAIRIPAGVTSIGDYSFYNCNSLASVRCLPEIPPTLDAFAFGLTHPDLKIYVPDVSVEQYKTATNWKEYADKIRPLSEAPRD